MSTPAGGETVPAMSGWRTFAPLLVAFLLSLALLWFAAKDALVLAGFTGGILTMGGLAWWLLPRRDGAEAVEFVSPDWSVTHAAISHPDSAVAITDRAGRMVCASPSFAEWFGGQSVPPALPLEQKSQEKLEDAARSAWRDGSGTTQGLTALTSSGSWTAQVYRAGRGEDYLVWRFTQLEQSDPVAETSRHIAGKAGRAMALQGIQAALVSPDGTILAANPAFTLRAAGDAEAAVTGTDFVSYLCSDEQERIFYAREGGNGTALRLIHIPAADPDSAFAVTEVPALMVLIDSDATGGEAGTAIAQIEALLARLPLGLAMTDRDGRFLFANEAFLRAAGHADSVAPPYPSDLVIREDKGALSDAVRRYAQGAPTRGDVAVRLLSSPEDPISLSLAGVRGFGEGAVLLSLKDSSEETRLKREIAQATKMQAVGQLAGGVAHDFNNVLTAIIGYCDLMLMRHTPGDSDYDDIQQIKANSNRAASLTRQLLAFSRQQTLRPEVLQLPDVVSEVSALLKRLIGEKIQLVVNHDRNLGAVRADPVQLEQVLLNLVVNARDAIQSRDAKAAGTVRLSTHRVTAANVRAMRSEILPVGDYTALVVEDDGCGIKPDQIGKIFEPFFTTNDTGKGTGLGLSTVYGIVKQSGGFIFADSELGKGTRFSIYLPVHIVDPADVADIAPRQAAPQRAWSGGGRILLVEDEDTVRAVAERALTRQGYEVTVAADGEEGLDHVRAAGQFDLVVSDVVMPSMDGPAMAREIRKVHPALPIIFMSGYAEEQLRREIDIPNMHFLAKPFSVQQIADTVEMVLRSKV